MGKTRDWGLRQGLRDSGLGMGVRRWGVLAVVVDLAGGERRYFVSC